MKRVLCVWLAWIWVGMGCGAGEALPLDRDQPLRVRQTVLPTFPRTLLTQGITEGWARVVINVDATGVLSDWLMVGYTREEFGRASVEALRLWEFTPMRFRGEPTPSQVEVSFRYEAKGVVIDITAGMDFTQLWLQRIQEKIYRPRTMKEIDGIPVPTVWVEPRFPAELEQRGVIGSATVAFYIDETGAVRMPAVVRADFPELGHLLAEAVRQWKFEPPTQRGRPVLVHASQTVMFGREE